MKAYKVTLNEMDGSHSFYTSYSKAKAAMRDDAQAQGWDIEKIDVQAYRTCYTFDQSSFQGIIETVFVN